LREGVNHRKFLDMWRLREKLREMEKVIAQIMRERGGLNRKR